MFSVLSKIHKDLITDSQKTVESTIEKLTQEIGKDFQTQCILMIPRILEQKQISNENAVEHLGSFQQKLQELAKSIDAVSLTILF